MEKVSLGTSASSCPMGVSGRVLLGCRFADPNLGGSENEINSVLISYR